MEPHRPEADNSLPAKPRRSRVRVVLGWVVLCLIAAACVSYAWFTSDAYIRRAATLALRRMTGGDVSIGGAAFSWFGGVKLTEVRIATPRDMAFYGPMARPDDCEFIHAGAIELAIRPWLLLVGRFEMTSIIAAAPRVHVVHRADQRKYNWSLLVPMPRAKPAAAGGTGPSILLRGAEIRVTRLDQDQRTEAPPFDLDADAWPHGHIDGAYLVDYRVYGDTPHRARSLFDPQKGEFSGSPYVRLEDLREVLPAEFLHACQRADLKGDFRLKRLTFSPSKSAAATNAQPADAKDKERIRIEFRRLTARLTLPWRDESSAAGAPNDAYTPYALTDGTGWMELVGGDLTVDLRALLNGQPLAVAGLVRNMGSGAAGLSYEFRVDGERLPFPDDAVTERILADMTVPPPVRYFVYDFDARGQVNVNAVISRRPGDDAVQISGQLCPVGLSAAYDTFRYRIDDLRGTVRFAADGIHFDRLIGRRGDAEVSVTGTVNNIHRSTGFDIEVLGRTITLDDSVAAALPPRHRWLWDLFEPSGLADAQVIVNRQEAGPGESSGSQTISVAITFRDARLCLRSFPYPLDRVCGVMRIQGRRLTFEDVSGEHAGARVHVNGWAEQTDDGGPMLDLTVSGDALPLDDTLLTALPPDARAAIASLSPSGAFDVTGRIWQDSGAPMEYDLRARIRGMSASHPAVPLPLDQLHGLVRITPRVIELSGLTGMQRGASIAIAGAIPISPGRLPADQDQTNELHIIADGLLLDDRLVNGLPESLRQNVEQFRLRGLADAELMVDTSDGAGQVTHMTVALRDAEFLPPAIPIRARGVTARLSLIGRRVVIHSLRGEPMLTLPAGDAQARAPAGLLLQGHFDSSAGRSAGNLALTVTGMSLQAPEVALLLPPALRDAWRAMKPRGTATVNIPQLALSTSADGAAVWDARGDLRLMDAAWNAGVECAHGTGSITGHIRIGGDRIDADSVSTRWDRLTIMQFPVTDLAANIEQQGAEWRLSDVTARACGGSLSGFVTYEAAAPRSRYGLSLSISDARVADVSAALSDGGPPSAGARGQVVASLALRGAAGDPASREGRGDIMARDLRAPNTRLVPALFASLGRKADEKPFDDVRMSYMILGHTMHVTRIDVQGGSLALGGAGTIDLPSGRMDLHLVTATPNALRVPILTELLEGATREVIELRVGGTWNAPDVRAQPLRSVQQFMQDVLGRPNPARR